MRQQKAVGALEGHIEEITASQKVIKIFNHEAKAEADFTVGDSLQQPGE